VSRSVWKNEDGKTVRRNVLAKQYNSRPVELLNCSAFRVLSRHAHLALARIELELRQHGGHRNGKLIVTTLQFIEYGIERRRIPEALRELDALGIIRITVRGRGGNADHRHPNRFLLNYQCGAVDAHDQITNAWNRFKNLDEAEEIAAAARAARDPHKVAYSRRNAGKMKNISQVPKKHFPGTKTVPKTANSQVPKRYLQAQVPKRYLLSIYRVVVGDVGANLRKAHPLSLPASPGRSD
jgi:hypothetical protein